MVNPLGRLYMSSLSFQQHLAQMFGISGIPTLVILDKKGETVTKNGRGLVGDNAPDKKFEF